MILIECCSLTRGHRVTVLCRTSLRLGRLKKPVRGKFRVSGLAECGNLVTAWQEVLSRCSFGTGWDTLVKWLVMLMVRRTWKILLLTRMVWGNLHGRVRCLTMTD